MMLNLKKNKRFCLAGQKGTSMIEAMLYVALYSILSLGFVLCAFGLQSSMIKNEQIQQDMDVSSMIRALLQDRIDHSDSVALPDFLGTPSPLLVLVINGAKASIGSSTLRRLLKSYPALKLEDVSFSLDPGSESAFRDEYSLAATYSLNGRQYEMHISLP